MLQKNSPKRKQASEFERKASVLVSSLLTDMKSSLSPSNTSTIIDKERAAALLEAVNAQTTEIQQLRQDNDQLVQSYQQLQQTNTILEENLKILEEKTNDTSIYQNKQEDYNKMDEKIKLLDEKNNELTDKLASQEYDYKKIMEKNSESQETILKLQNEILKLKQLNFNTNISPAASKFGKNNEKLQNENQQLREENKALVSENNELTNEIESMNQYISDLNEKIMKLESVVQDDESLNQVYLEIEVIKQENDQLKEENDQLKEENGELINKLSENENKHQKSLEQIKALSNENSSLKDYSNQSKQEKKDSIIIINDLEQKIAELQNMNTQLNSQIESLKVRQKTPTKDNSQNQIVNDPIIMQSQPFEIRSNQILNEAMNYIEPYKKQVLLLTQTNSDLEKKIISYETEIDSFNQKVLRHETQLAQLQEEVSTYKSLYTSAKVKKEEIHEELIRLKQAKQGREHDDEIFLESLASILHCETRAEVHTKINELFNELSEYKDICTQGIEKQRDYERMKAKCESLTRELESTKQMMNIEIEKSLLIKDGKENEIVGRMSQNFNQMKQQYSELLNEHQEIKSQLFDSQSQVEQLTSQLAESNASNSVMQNQLKLFTFYEYSYGQFVQCLSTLSNSLISTFNMDESVKQKQQIVDSLLIELRRQTFKPNESQQKWANFIFLCEDAFISTQNVKTRMEQLIEATMSMFNDHLNEVSQRFNILTLSINQISQKTLKVVKYRTPTKQVSLLDSTRRLTPQPPKYNALGSPLRMDLHFTPRKIPYEPPKKSYMK